MPIYEYYCECGLGGEVNLLLRDFGQPQICECGKVMQRKVSLSYFAVKPTGRQMALDTLNGDAPSMPRQQWTHEAELGIAAGL
uniref:Putative regulatory protein FmdB zinc ribbon domain-containing protein n=1 Tax=viral metagenome TaxID=1070528 RepID=A0A6M3IFZ5_9ZZZZ